MLLQHDPVLACLNRYAPDLRVIGQTRFAYDIWGDAVNIASRMESSSEAGRVQVTEEIQAKLQQDLLFEERGSAEVKSKDMMKTYFLTGKR